MDTFADSRSHNASTYEMSAVPQPELDTNPLLSGHCSGKAARKPLLSTWDVVLTVVSLLLFLLASVTIMNETVAIYLGQKYQLVVVGFCLSMMGYCSQRSLQYALLSVETSSRGSLTRRPTIIQNLDAIIGITPFPANISIVYRFILAGMFCLPLGLSVAYKSFQDGHSTSPLTGPTASNFGLTGPPGTQDIGYGLSLFVNATLPWFEDPGFDRVYGFNMYVANSSTTAMLDGPLASDVKSIQASLRNGQSRTVEANVRAIVATYNESLSESRDWLNGTFYEDTNVTSAGYQWETAYIQFVYNASFYCGIMVPKAETYTTVWLSWWSLLDEQTFGSEVRQYSLTRQWMRGVWTISPSSASLQTAVFLDQASDDTERYLGDNWLAAGQLFIAALTEYDYRFRQYGPSRFAANNTKYDTYIVTDASLVASMIWARVTALNGPQAYAPSDPHSLGYMVNTTQTVRNVTLERSRLLLLVLAINPVCMIVALAISLCYYSSPIGQGFGVVAMLAAAVPESLAFLGGAGLSGELRDQCPVSFQVAYDQVTGLRRPADSVSDADAAAAGGEPTMQKRRHPKITMIVGDEAPNAHVKRGEFYE